MSRPTPPTYKTRNWPAYNEALKRRGSLTIWFDPEMSWDAAPTGRRGRQQTYSDAAIQTCLTMKVLFGMALRQTTGFVESLLRLVGLDWTVPDFSTLSRRQKTLAVNIPYRGSKGPLHLLIDSTGIKVEGEGEWHARKHGGPKRRVWRKIHLGIDEETLEIRAVEITGSHIGDAPVLPDLLDQIPATTRDRQRHRRRRLRHPQMPRCHRRPRRPCCHPAPQERQAVEDRHRRSRRAKRGPARIKYLGRALWRRWSGYHRRSRVETKMHCVKLLGQRLMARDFDRQVAELQVRIAVLNGYTALGIPVTEAVG
jgi:hypothetical protein